MILVMNGANKSIQSFSSQVGIGSTAHCFIGASRINVTVSLMSIGSNDSSRAVEMLSEKVGAAAPSVDALIPDIFLSKKVANCKVDCS